MEGVGAQQFTDNVMETTFKSVAETSSVVVHTIESSQTEKSSMTTSTKSQRSLLTTEDEERVSDVKNTVRCEDNKENSMDNSVSSNLLNGDIGNQLMEETTQLNTYQRDSEVTEHETTGDVTSRKSDSLHDNQMIQSHDAYENRLPRDESKDEKEVKKRKISNDATKSHANQRESEDFSDKETIGKTSHDVIEKIQILEPIPEESGNLEHLELEDTTKMQPQSQLNHNDSSKYTNHEGGARSHTWQPKGIYKLEKTIIKHEDVVSIEVPDVKMNDRPSTPPEKEQPQPKTEQKKEQKKKKETIPVEEDRPQRPFKVLRTSLVNGEVISPLEIPVGIPLLAKILPKDENEEAKDKIPLERLFTPAADWEEIVPQRKKAFASSCFYRPDHPTIDDQVELAQKISTSLVDETNRASKGQSMYIKRKNRSAKWIHQAASQYDEPEEEEEPPKPPSKEKPPLKLFLSPKGPQDYTAVQQHYEELLSSSQTLQQISNMEVSKEIANNLQSPTGKGAALFARRKKRMDKFIVDETTVQQQQHPNIINEAEKAKTIATGASSMSYETRKYEKQFSSQVKQQSSISMLHDRQPLITASSTQSKETSTSGGLALPDLTTILTKPRPQEKKIPSLEARGITKKPHSSQMGKSGFRSPQVSQGVPPREKVVSKRSQKCAAGKSAGAGHRNEEASIPNGFYEDPLANLRPGSPPIFMIPNGLEDVSKDHMESRKPHIVQYSSPTSEASKHNGTENIFNKTATNAASYGLTFEANQTFSRASIDSEHALSSAPSKHMLKQTNNQLLECPVVLRPKQVSCFQRPCSLPTLPFSDFTAPCPFDRNSSAYLSFFNASHSQPFINPNLLAKSSNLMCHIDSTQYSNVQSNSCINTINKLLANENVSVDNRTSVPSEVDNSKPHQSSLTEPSPSGMTGFLKPMLDKSKNTSAFDDNPGFHSFTNKENNLLATNQYNKTLITNTPMPFAQPGSSIDPMTELENKRFGEQKNVTESGEHKTETIDEQLQTRDTNITISSKMNSEHCTESDHYMRELSDIHKLDDANRVTVTKTVQTPDETFATPVHKTEELKEIIEELDKAIIRETDLQLDEEDIAIKREGTTNEHNGKDEKHEMSTEIFEIQKQEDIILSEAEIPKADAGIGEHQRSSLVNEKDVENFISEIERSFSESPLLLQSVNIQDLQPPEFYQSVEARNETIKNSHDLQPPEIYQNETTKNNQDLQPPEFYQSVEVRNETSKNSQDLQPPEFYQSVEARNETTKTRHDLQPPEIYQNKTTKNSQDLQPPEFYQSVEARNETTKNCSYETSHHIEEQTVPLHQENYPDTQPNRADLTNYTSEHVYSKENMYSYQAHKIMTTNHITQHYSPLLTQTQPITNALSSPIIASLNIEKEGSKRYSDVSLNVSPWSAENVAIYKAEVKLIQQPASLPPSPVISFEAPQQPTCLLLTAPQQPTCLLNEFGSSDAEKRKSFNLAPKGWGTYTSYYTPVHLEAQ